MTLPPGLLAAALLFWGWRTGLWLPAVPMALLLELAPRVTWRWALDDPALARVIDLSALLWIGALIILFTRYLNQPPLATHLYTLLSWIPLLLFLPLAMQRYSTAGAFRVGHLFYSLRRSKSELAQRPLQLDAPYFVCGLLAAGVTVQPGFLPGIGLLLLWLLIAARPRRHRWPLTLTLVVVAALVAWPLSVGLHRFQLAMEDTLSEWFEDWFIEVDPYRARTALGDIGELKLSGRIVLRLKSAPSDPGPWLLRDAAYNHYFDGVWQAKNTRFTDLKPTGDGREWPLLIAPASQSHRLAISLELRRGTGMLPMPPGAWRLDRLPVGALQVSSLGAIKASEGPGLLDYGVEYDPSADRDSPPAELDLGLPRREQATLQRLAAELDLINQPPAMVAARVHAFLTGQFRYSLDLPAPATGLTALETFLLQTRAGHCEYFASAAALLLRAAGIPARYATGFSVAEYRALEGVYVARRRHAHAWTLIWQDGRWQDFDATPSDWTSFEDEQASWWQGIGDLWAWLNHQFSRWRWREATGAESDHRGWWGVIGGLTAVLFWRLLRRQRVRQRSAAKPAVITVWPGAESPFYQIVAALTTRAGARPPGESLEHWLWRIGVGETAEIRAMVDGHQRWRFDPAGLSAAEQHQLAETVAAWLKVHAAQ